MSVDGASRGMRGSSSDKSSMEGKKQRTTEVFVFQAGVSHAVDRASMAWHGMARQGMAFCIGVGANSPAGLCTLSASRPNISHPMPMPLPMVRPAPAPSAHPPSTSTRHVRYSPLPRPRPSATPSPSTSAPGPQPPPPSPHLNLHHQLHPAARSLERRVIPQEAPQYIPACPPQFPSPPALSLPSNCPSLCHSHTAPVEF